MEKSRKLNVLQFKKKTTDPVGLALYIYILIRHLAHFYGLIERKRKFRHIICRKISEYLFCGESSKVVRYNTVCGLHSYPVLVLLCKIHFFLLSYRIYEILFLAAN